MRNAAMNEERMVAGEAIVDPAIVADGASKLFLDGAVVAFHQLSLAVKRNEIMCVVGPSGCGKTTFLRCIAGLTDLSSGRLLVHGKAVGARPPDGVAMVFQHYREAAPSASPERGCVTTVEGVRGELSDATQPVDLSGDQARAERVAAARRHRRRLIDLAIRVASLAIALTLWEVAAWNVDPVLFTSPTKVAVAAYHMVLSGELWTYLWPSLVVLAIGFAFAVVLGIGIGLLLARFWVLDVALTVYITFLYSIPSVALVPLIVLWAGFDTTAKVIILFLFAFFPMVINTYQGVKSVDPKLIEVGRAFRCSEGQLWWNIMLPASLPFIVTGLRLALGRGLIGMVLADLYTAISGIGYLIVRTASTYQVDKMFVPIVTLGLLGVTLTALLRLAEKYVAPWTAASRDD